MKSISELKREARTTLNGRWGSAALLNLIPVLLGIIIASIILIPAIIFFQSVDFSQTMDTVSSNNAYDAGNSAGSSGGGLFGGIISALFTSGITWTLLEVVRKQRTEITPIKDAFRAFSGTYFLPVIGLFILQSIFVFLWSLLLVIPGIIKGYAYSQTYFVYYDTTEQTGNKPGLLDSITASRRLMNGYKGKLFLLDLSFIGWHILAIMTFGIGYIWLNPYIYTTKAAFYDALPKNPAY